MVLRQVFEGTGAELQEHLKQHPKDRFRLILITTDGALSEKAIGAGLRRGMFPQLRGLTEEEFKVAEWHDQDSEL